MTFSELEQNVGKRVKFDFEFEGSSEGVINIAESNMRFEDENGEFSYGPLYLISLCYDGFPSAWPMSVNENNISGIHLV